MNSPLMNILFICRQNVGRSQAAMELYRQKGGESNSAGTAVDNPNTTLAKRPGAANILQVMREDHDIDMINNIRTQLTEALASPYDKLVVMAEQETWPEWLRNDKRVLYWNILDTKGQDLPNTRKVVTEINEKLDALVKDFHVS